MKILTLHCDYIRFKPLKKAVKDAEELTDKEEKEIKECLVVLTAVEKGDSDEILQQMLDAVKKTAKEVKTNTIVLYPYAHLSSNLAPPATALEYLVQAEATLKQEKYAVTRAPFGHYKQFELKVKGHPLSELSKEFRAEGAQDLPKTEVSRVTKELEVYDPAKLLRELSKTKLDTSKLRENDHRIIGQKLDLFSFNEAAPGQPFWHDAGYFIYNRLIEFVRNLQNKFGYKEVSTPQIVGHQLFKVSGHWDHYRENMFLTSYENRDFGVKPMSCPGGMLIFKSSPKSYKDLPIRMAEFGVVHRKELSGVIAGLLRVIRITQDDAHIFCTREQIGEEMARVLELVKIIYSTFGFDYSLELSTRPEKSMGDPRDWEYAERTLEDALKKSKIKYKINKGDGAFYGPKIDIHIKDSLGRSWQCATVQLDMQMPKRFELTYIGEDGKEHTPYIIHRAILGSVERFTGVLLEHLNGNLPLWLSPRQVRVVSFTDRNIKAAQKLADELKKELPQLRIDTDLRPDTIQSKIRDAELLKVNYVVCIGDKEEESKTIAVRPRGGKPQFGVKKDTFIEQLLKELEI